MNRIKLSYLAGAIDSDGTIGIKKNSYHVKIIKDSTQPTYSERICLKQVTPQIPNLLKKYFKGYFGITKPQTVNGKPLFTWQVTDLKAVFALKSLLPYLQVKKKQALNCLKLRSIKEKSKKARVAFGRGHIGSSCRPIRFSKSMEKCLVVAHLLNKAGI